jgi:CDP-diacylglycerol---serine O-phosphatidyltransferase
VRRMTSVDSPKPPKHFSMIRGFHLADLFTLSNGLSGVTAIFEAMRFLAGRDSLHLYAAAALVPLALVFDVLDGRVARWRHRASPMGRDLDSLADVISFGVAPAAIAFSAGINTVADQLILGFFSICGLSRLARYNITAEALSAETGKVTHFEGAPITTSILPLGLILWGFHRGELYPVRLGSVSFHLMSIAFFVSGCLMISKSIRIPKP